MYFTLADLMTDITQNACESGATCIELELMEGRGELYFTVQDNGKGMNEDALHRASDPFVSDGLKHPQRKVGLGIPLFIQTAEQSGGNWKIQSETGKGTTVSGYFDTTHVDTPPLGDVPEMFRTMLLFEGQKMLIRRSRQGSRALDYTLCKTELIQALDGLNDTGSLMLLDKHLRSLEAE